MPSQAPPDNLSDIEAQMMVEFMERTVALAQQPFLLSGRAGDLQDHKDTGGCQASHAGQELDPKADRQLATASNAALIVDPASGEVIAEGLDNTATHPLHHAAMVAVARAAERDLRMWPQVHENATLPVDVPACTSDSLDVSDHGCAAECAQCQPSICCANRCEGHDRKRQRVVTGSGEEQGGPKPCPSCAATSRRWHSCSLLEEEHASLQKPSSSAHARTEHSDGGLATALAGQKSYLCTGFHCYLVREPCAMCAMALVHSRVRRIVYCVPDDGHGALGGSFRLHGQRSLNHHYQVYRCQLHDLNLKEDNRFPR
jgi:tRNA-specific adenosine deaminase 3